MTTGKHKKTPIIVMKKKHHVITLLSAEEQITSSVPSEILPEAMKSSSPAHQTKKNRKWTPEFINTSLEKIKTLFSLLHAEEGSFRPLKIGITRDVTDFIAQNPDAGLTLPE